MTAIVGTLTGTVVCTSCGPIPAAEARGISMSPDPTPGYQPWRVRIGDTYYMIPWQLVRPNPPCPRCTVGELTVEDIHIAGMVVRTH